MTLKTLRLQMTSRAEPSRPFQCQSPPLLVMETAKIMPLPAQCLSMRLKIVADELLGTPSDLNLPFFMRFACVLL